MAVDRLAGVPDHERHLYSLTRAFGRFGMRIFEPSPMDAPHWHGHVELNLLTGAAMTYDVDGTILEVPPGRVVAFWAGIPHQLTELRPTGDGPMRLANIYLPLDAFLHFGSVPSVQIDALNGAVIQLGEDALLPGQFERWYADYRSRDFERREIVKMEVNALFRRAVAVGYGYLLAPGITPEADGGPISPQQMSHVIAMLRHIQENLGTPISVSEIASVTGLHSNYALTLFSRAMRMPPKRFVTRMRLLRARALLVESAMPIGTIAGLCGFSSLSQFYEHFKQAYGTPPSRLRKSLSDARGA